MKLNGKFMIRQVVDEVLAIPVGETALRFNGMIVLNAVSRVIWQCLEEETEIATIVAAVTEQFEVEPAQAEADIEAFLDKLRQKDLLEE